MQIVPAYFALNLAGCRRHDGERYDRAGFVSHYALVNFELGGW